MNNSVNIIWNLNLSHWQQTDVEIKCHNKCFPINFFHRTQKESLMEPLRTRNIKTDSELESKHQDSFRFPSLIITLARNCSTSDNSTPAPPSRNDWHLGIRYLTERHQLHPINWGSGTCSRCPWIQQGELQSDCLQLRAAVWLEDSDWTEASANFLQMD